MISRCLKYAAVSIMVLALLACGTLDGDPETADVRAAAERRQRGAVRIPVIRANAQELAAHERALETIERASNGPALFRATDRRAGEG